MFTFEDPNPDPDGSYIVRSDENGARLDIACTEFAGLPDPVDPVDPVGPVCTLTVSSSGGVTLTWTPFNGEDDFYQVRRDPVWLAAVAADGELVFVDPSPDPDGVYRIRSNERGRVDQVCVEAGDSTDPVDPGELVVPADLVENLSLIHI